MIVTVTCNPAIDYVISVDHFQPGRINHTYFEELQAGGKGVNVSRVLRQLGYESTILGFTAGDTGNLLTGMLKEEGMYPDFVRVNKGMTRINVKMRSDDETEINGAGPFVTDEDVRELLWKLNALKEGDTLVLSGSVPSSLSDTLYMDILKDLRERNIMTIVDAEGQLLIRTLPYHPFLIKPNSHELGEIFHTEIRTKEEALFYAEKLQKTGARNVLISMAGDGAVLLSENGEKIQGRAPKGKVLNSVGAGDSMVAGFLAGWLDTHDMHQALRLAICAGSATAFSEGLADMEHIRKLAENYNLS